VIREAVVETLAETLERGGILDGLAPIFAEFVGKANASEVLDLCAGAGNPARILVRSMLAQGNIPPGILLTDLYPRTDAWYDAKAEFPNHISFVRDSVDATAIPASLSSGRARTIINAFHHLPPALAQRVLDDAIASRSPILIAECFGRNPLGFVPLARRGLATLAGNPLFARHHRYKRALLTWAVPVIPAIAVWDGLVSTMRVYSEDDLRAMTAHSGAAFDWVYRTWEFPWGGTGNVFYGIPVSG
jgi:hypothetical protein